MFQCKSLKVWFPLAAETSASGLHHFILLNLQEERGKTIMNLLTADETECR